MQLVAFTLMAAFAGANENLAKPDFKLNGCKLLRGL